MPPPLFRLARWALCGFLALSAAGLPPAVGAASRPYPRLAGTLPSVERAVSDTLRRHGLLGRVMRVAADTNGFLTVVALTVTDPEDGAGVEDYVGRVVQAVLADPPNVDEVDVTAVARQVGTPDADVTLTAAASRAEVSHLRPDQPPAALARQLPRVWTRPPQARPAAPLGKPTLGAPKNRPFDPVRAAAEELRELADRVHGFAWGEAVGGKVYRGDPCRRSLALTFDDGPEPLYTPLLLDALHRLHVQATFFLVGRRVEQYPYFAAAIARAGHELGNHGYSHANLTRLAPSEIRADLEAAQQAILRATGHRPRLFRPPGGRYDRPVVEAASELGLLTVLWTDDPGDYQAAGVKRLKTRLLSRVYSGGIVLLHQGVPETLRVLPATWEVLRRHGYTLTTVGHLLRPQNATGHTTGPLRELCRAVLRLTLRKP